jgi:hypothetical protein
MLALIIVVCLAAIHTLGSNLNAIRASPCPVTKVNILTRCCMIFVLRARLANAGRVSFRSRINAPRSDGPTVREWEARTLAAEIGRGTLPPYSF